MAGVQPPDGTTKLEWQWLNWRKRNHPFSLEFHLPKLTHDETLEPHHVMQGWDVRCEACRKAEVFMQTVSVKT